MRNIEIFEDLSTLLIKSINKLKKRYPRYSNLQIAKKLNIPKSTFDRYSKGEVNTRNSDYVIAILFEVYDQAEVICHLDSFFPRTAEMFFNYVGFKTERLLELNIK